MNQDKLNSFKEYLISIQNKLTEMRNELSPQVSDKIKQSETSFFHYLCLTIANVDGSINTITKTIDGWK